MTGGSLDSHEELLRPLYFQGTEEGHLIFQEHCHHTVDYGWCSTHSHTALGLTRLKIA